MALKGLDIFKLTPKTNCKECGSPTCMAFAMKVAQGAVALEKCPHMGADVIAKLAEATAPPMKQIEIGAGNNAHKLGGETVLFRHEKTLVNKNLFATKLCSDMDDAKIDAVLAQLKHVDYERIGERMYCEFITVSYAGNGADKYVAAVKKAMAADRGLILDVDDIACAKAALDVCKDQKPILLGANAANKDDMSKLAAEAGVVLGVRGADLNELFDTVTALEAAGNKNLILDVTGASIKETYKNAVLVRRSCLKEENRTFGYPSIVDLTKIAGGDERMQSALAAAFTLKYGSIIVMDGMSYAQALPLYGLRQNIFTDPQKPMKVAPGIYPMNGADENAPCMITVDFALTYFVVSGEIERSGVPANFLITDAGGYSVLTSWAAGKFSANSISKFVKEEVEGKVKTRTLIIPGKVAVLKGELEDKLPGWNIVVGTTEAIQITKFLKENKF